MITFKILDHEISFPDNIENYNILWKQVSSKKIYYTKDFVDKYDQWADIEIVSENISIYGKQAIENTFKSFSDIFMERGMFDFGTHYLYEHPLYSKYINNFTQAINNVKKTLSAINSIQQQAEYERDLAKESRLKLQGGGFSLPSAISGIITAEAINFASGIAYSAFNAVGNLFTYMSTSSSKDELYRKSKAYLLNALQKDITNLTIILADLTNNNIPLDSRMALSIISNIDNKVINDNFIEKALIKGLESDPYNEDLYKYFIFYRKNSEDEIVQMSKYFNISLDNYLKILHEVNGYYFKDIEIAQKARQLLDEFNIQPFFLESRYWNKENKYLLLAILISLDNIFNTSSEDELKNFINKYRHTLSRTYNVVSGIPLEELDVNLIEHNKEDILNYYKEQFKGTKKISLYDNTKDILNSILRKIHPNISPYVKVYMVIKTSYNEILILSDIGITFINISTNDMGEESLDLKYAINIFMSDLAEVRLEVSEISEGCKNLIIYLKNSKKYYFYLGKVVSDFSYFIRDFINTFLPYISPYVINNRLELAKILKEDQVHKEVNYLYDDGKSFEDNEQYQNAFECYLTGFMFNDSSCAYRLGVLYSSGLYVDLDYEKAKYWLQRSANMGNEEATNYIQKYKVVLDTLPNISREKAFSGKEFQSPMINTAMKKIINFEIAKIEKIRREEELSQDIDTAIGAAVNVGSFFI